MRRAELILAVHRIRHEHGDLWSPTDGCGCAEWADALLRALDDVRKEHTERVIASERDPGDHFAYPCDDCGRTDGTHDDEVEH
jgi:hypothetical protein